METGDHGLSILLAAQPVEQGYRLSLENVTIQLRAMEACNVMEILGMWSIAILHRAQIPVVI